MKTAGDFWTRRREQLRAELDEAARRGDVEAENRVLAALQRIGRERLAAGKLDAKKAAGAR